VATSIAAHSTDIQINAVLIATDFSPASAKALRHAVSIAEHYGARLFLVHVVSSIGLRMAGPDAIVEATTAAQRDAMFTERQLVASGALAGIHHHMIVRPGDDVWSELQAIIRKEGIDLLVIGIHNRTGLKKLVLGSVAEQIFRQAQCRVLTVGPGSPPEARLKAGSSPGSLLFPTDFSVASLRALPFAISLANVRGNRLVLLHAALPSFETEGYRNYTVDDAVTMLDAQRAQIRGRLKGLVAHAHLEVEPAFAACTEDPAEGILRTAKSHHAELIVMGLKHRTRFAAICHSPWSIAHDVACGASCPVLTVRSDSPDESRFGAKEPKKGK
jgi:nucleotide-binding universal stress UspA family protein